MEPKSSTLGWKLLWAVGVPALAVGLFGVALTWWRADRVVTEAMAMLQGQRPLDEAVLRAHVNTVFRGAFLGVVIFGSAVSALVAFSLRALLTRPLHKLTDVMQRAEQGDILVRAPETGADELSSLGRAFNRMLARLTEMKADEIDTHRDLAAAHEQLGLKKALEQTNSELQQRITELSLLYDIVRSLVSTLELPELLARITRLVPERLEVPKFSIMLLSSDQKLEVRSAHPPGLGTEGITFELGEGVCGRAAQLRRALYVSDLETDSTYFKVRPGTAAKGRGSLLAVPMVHGGVLLGVLNFERPDKAAISPDEIDFLQAVADQAALAVRNAQLYKETVELSLTDALTGAPNRRALFNRLELEIARANRFGTQLSMLMIDIDHFKKLNDAAGHRAGDAVLRQVCDLMRSMTRKVDTLARYGGEEFVLLLPQVSKTEASEVAEKLRAKVYDAPFEHGHVQPGGHVTISVGVANLPADATEQDRLVDSADSALYASKRGGRNLVTQYAPGMELHPGRERGPRATRPGAGEEAALLLPRKS